MVIASTGFSQYTGVVYFSRLYVFPVEDAVFQNHIAVGTVFLRDAQGAGVEVDVPRGRKLFSSLFILSYPLVSAGVK